MSNCSGIAHDYEQRLVLLEICREILDLANEDSDPATRYHFGIRATRYGAHQAICDLNSEFGVVDRDATKQRDEAKSEYERFGAAVERFDAMKKPDYVPTYHVASATALPAFAMLLAGLLGLIAAWIIFGRPALTGSTLLVPIITHIAGFVVTGFFLGAGPAGFISVEAQQWSLTLLMLCAMIWVGARVAIRMSIRLRYSLSSLLVLTTGMAVGVQLCFLLDIGWEAVGLPIGINAEADPMMNFVSKHQPGAIGRALGDPNYVVMLALEWLAHDGPSWSVAIYLVLIGESIVFARDKSHAVGRATLATSLFCCAWFNAWVWLEPSVQRLARPEKIAAETYIHDIAAYYKTFKVELAKE